MSDKIVTACGFEATVVACKTLGLDIKDVPLGVLQIFYNSGMAFADHPGAFSHEQRQTWRDSVIWPKHREKREPDSLPKLPPIIQNPRPSRSRKNAVE